MNMQQYHRMIDKVKRMMSTYNAYLSENVAELDVEIYETAEHLFNPPHNNLFKPIQKGETWGNPFQYAWFKSTVKITDALAGKKLWIEAKTNAPECLLFINGKPTGLFDISKYVSNPDKTHRFQPLTENSVLNETIEIVLEGYAGNEFTGAQPFDTAGNAYPASWPLEFDGIQLVEIDETLEDFLISLEMLAQMYDCLHDDDFNKWEIAKCFEKLFTMLVQKPEFSSKDEIKHSVTVAKALIEEQLATLQGNDSTAYAGLIGHSHLDTAWLWPVSETVHKAARTFSNALTLMNTYDDYMFFQSSVVYLDWMKKYYPQIFDEIKQRVKEGRWEPNGGSWVEIDGNMTSGESMIRQFLKGQQFLKENFGYHADTFWLPDTFGYSAAIPQIMKSFNMKYFLTTKLSWNDTNQFPYDSFTWRGIDGSEVLTHFNLIHCTPDPRTLINSVRNIQDKKTVNMRLVSYGFGDGGGGPTKKMVKLAQKVQNLKGLPKAEYTSVSRFMHRLEASNNDFPLYYGELYVEGHRGTLTQMHEIKRTNRKSEIALRDLEVINVIADNLYGTPPRLKEINELYDILLVNQFHDILPGSSISHVHKLAIVQNNRIIKEANASAQDLVSTIKTVSNDLIVFNTLGWDRKSQMQTDYKGFVPENEIYQKYEDIDRSEKLSILLGVPALSARNIKMKSDEHIAQSSPFTYENKTLSTPYAKVTFDEKGFISSFVDTTAQRELRNPNGSPLNTLLIGEDVPAAWDNWDIDADQQKKMNSSGVVLLSSEVVSNGPLQFRIRNNYKLDKNSNLVQDVVFYANTPQVDFETVVDWNSKYTLLKTEFDVSLTVNKLKTETQFGYIDRNAYKNNNYDIAKFEFPNHKWTSLAENRYGVALLNDCKYGISVDGSDMRLTLHKGGCHPDPGGDSGRHSFVYSFLPHNSGFCTEAVIRPAYELNIPLTVSNGTLKKDIPPMIAINEPNILLEAIKFSEDSKGYILRLYEAECSGVQSSIKINFKYSKIELVNMMEETIEELIPVIGIFELEFKGFEIKSVKITI